MERDIKLISTAIAQTINNSPDNEALANITFSHKDEAEQDQIVDMVVKLAKKNFIVSHPIARKNGDMISDILWGTDSQNIEEWESDGIPFEWLGAKDLQC